MAHNLARWTARIGLGQQVVTTKTLRRRFFSLAGRLTRKARRLTLHLPQHWPWETQFSRALAPVASPAISCLTAPDPSTRLPNRPANSRHPGPRVSLAASSPRHLALPTFANGHKVSTRLLKAATGPIYPKSCPNHRPLCHSSPIRLL